MTHTFDKTEYNKKENLSAWAFILKRCDQGQDFETIAMPKGYALETYINGNISHCAEYLTQLICTGKAGLLKAIDELSIIKEYNSGSYEYILNKLLAF